MAQSWSVATEGPSPLAGKDGEAGAKVVAVNPTRVDRVAVDLLQLLVCVFVAPRALSSFTDRSVA